MQYVDRVFETPEDVDKIRDMVSVFLWESHYVHVRNVLSKYNNNTNIYNNNTTIEVKNIPKKKGKASITQTDNKKQLDLF